MTAYALRFVLAVCPLGSNKNLLWSQVLSPHIHKMSFYSSITCNLYSKDPYRKGVSMFCPSWEYK